jgi:FixJ family two-component response regulator
VVGFFTKPIDRIALIAAIRAALGEDADGKAPGPA